MDPRADRALGIRPRLIARGASHPAAGRLLTGPLAFFLAGLIDLILFGAQMLRRRFASR